MTILDRPREQNIVVDFLSRIQNDNNDVCVEDNFLDEYIFVVSTQSPWFVDTANSFVSGKLPS